MATQHGSLAVQGTQSDAGKGHKGVGSQGRVGKSFPYVEWRSAVIFTFPRSIVTGAKGCTVEDSRFHLIISNCELARNKLISQMAACGRAAIY
jgi:hypothetical protein